MPTSIRDQLLAAIITAVGGEYDLPLPVDEAELPWTSVKDIVEEASDDGYEETNIEMEVVVGRGAAGSALSRAALRAQGSELLASIVAEMYVDETFGGLAQKTTYTGGVVTEEMGHIILVGATFKVTYSTVRGDPYTQ